MNRPTPLQLLFRVIYFQYVTKNKTLRGKVYKSHYEHSTQREVFKFGVRVYRRKFALTDERDTSGSALLLIATSLLVVCSLSFLSMSTGMRRKGSEAGAIRKSKKFIGDK